MKYSLPLLRKARRRGRAPQGARGLKFFLFVFCGWGGNSRAPQGARGLKF